MTSLGFRVFAGVRKEVDGQALQAKTSSPFLIPVTIDVTKADSIKDAFETIKVILGSEGLAGLVNNAGIVIFGPWEFINMEELHIQLEVNFIGQVAVTQAFLPLIRQGGGRIVNISSVSGRAAMPFLGPYAVSKAALEAYSDSLRLELRRWGIYVSIIQPGSIATPIWEKGLSGSEAWLGKLPDEALERYGRNVHRLRQRVIKSSAGRTPVKLVSRAIAHALTSRHPKTRYVVGNDALLALFALRLVPDRLRDWFIARMLRLDD
jgi:NAD(P)-dependent dehydrogenase (short-subunit alcohol dehydrogenase family)